MRNSLLSVHRKVKNNHEKIKSAVSSPHNSALSSLGPRSSIFVGAPPSAFDSLIALVDKVVDAGIVEIDVSPALGFGFVTLGLGDVGGESDSHRHYFLLDFLYFLLVNRFCEATAGLGTSCGVGLGFGGGGVLAT